MNGSVDGQFAAENFSESMTRPSDREKARILPVEVSFCSGVLLLVTAYAAVNLFRPFGGDVELFRLYAEAMAQGGVLYSDVWDVKQPAIFVFFWIGGSLFGFTEQGIHLFELLWWLVFTVTCFAILRRQFHNAWLAAAVPLVFLTTYYGYETTWFSTQIEVLVGFPILVSLWLLAKEYKSATALAWGFRLAGVLGALTVTFKLALAPMFIAFVLAATVEQWRTWRPDAAGRFVAALWINFTLGVAAFLGLVCLLCLVFGDLQRMLWTSFVFPWEALSLNDPAPLRRLLRATLFFVAHLAPWLPFVFVPFMFGSHGTRGSALTRMMWVWLVAGIAVFLIQRFSWWPYHVTLLFVPIAFLAVRGIDIAIRVFTEHARPRINPHVVAALLLLPGLAATVFPLARKGDDLFSILASRSQAAIVEYQSQFESRATTLRIADAIDWQQAVPGPIQVFGHPAIYRHADRRQALQFSGWATFILTPEQVASLPDQLLRARPVYVFVATDEMKTLFKIAPELLAVLETTYTQDAVLPEGAWYRLIDAQQG